jgi:hypothetical protein
MSNTVVAAIFCGDYRLVATPIDKLRSMFLGEDGVETTASDIDSVRIGLTYPPMVGGNKIVYVQPDLFDDDLCSLLAELAESASPRCMAVCRTRSVSPKCAAILKKIDSSRVKVIKLGSLNGFEDAVQFVRSRAEACGGRIDREASKNLVAVVGHDDASMLVSEVDKLLLVSNNDITEDIVAQYAFGGSSFRFFRLYTALAEGDFKDVVREMTEHIDTLGCEAVDMSISKLLTICCRINGSFGGMIETVHVDRINSHWWDEDDKNKYNPMPSKFMVECASKIVGRLGDGVQSLVKEAVSDMAIHRMASLPYPKERLYLKAAAICFGGRKDAFDILHWNRPISDGHRRVHT